MKLKKKQRQMLIGVFAIVGIGLVVRYVLNKAKKSTATSTGITLMPPQVLTPIAYKPTISNIVKATSDV